MIYKIKEAWLWFLEALFPSRCVICKKEGNDLCAEHQKFPLLKHQEYCPKYLDGFFAFSPYYDPLVEKTIENFKYYGVRGLSDILGL